MDCHTYEPLYGVAAMRVCTDNVNINNTLVSSKSLTVNRQCA
jgi:hypothetical protein